MTTLTIDIGNTSIKYAVFEGQTMVHYRRIIGHDIAPIAENIWIVLQPQSVLIWIQKVKC